MRRLPSSGANVSGTPRRHYEEALRSLGLIRYVEEYRHVVVVEIDDGFLVTSLRHSANVGRAADSYGRWASVATRFHDDEIAAMPDIGISRLGSGHRALRYETAPRLIGLWSDQQQASRVTIIDQVGTYRCGPCRTCLPIHRSRPSSSRPTPSPRCP